MSRCTLQRLGLHLAWRERPGLGINSRFGIGDSISGDGFRATMRQLITAHKTPLQNVYVKRLIGTLRRECIDHVIVMGEEHARQILAEFAT